MALIQSRSDTKGLWVRDALGEKPSGHGGQQVLPRKPEQDARDVCEEVIVEALHEDIKRGLYDFRGSGTGHELAVRSDRLRGPITHDREIESRRYRDFGKCVRTGFQVVIWRK